MKPWLASCLLALLALAGCETIPSSSAPAQGGGGSDLALGRRLYYGRCASCHAPEPITDYTKAEWRDMVAHMRQRAKLTPPEEAALIAFLMQNAADA